MDLYFRRDRGAGVDAGGGPEPHAYVARARRTAAPHAGFRRSTGWQRLRIDLLLENRRQRVRYHDKTLELARMVGARAAEAVIATHVDNAVGFTHLVQGVMPANGRDRPLSPRVRTAGRAGADGPAASAGPSGGPGVDGPV